MISKEVGVDFDLDLVLEFHMHLFCSGNNNIIYCSIDHNFVIFFDFIFTISYSGLS